MSYSSQVYEVLTDAEFDVWLDGLADIRAQRRIADRLLRVAGGLLGDVKYFHGIGEMRVDYGPGYRLYFITRKRTIIILLCEETSRPRSATSLEPWTWPRSTENDARGKTVRCGAVFHH